MLFFFHLPPDAVLKKFPNLDSHLLQNKFSRYFTHSDIDKKEKKLPTGGADVGENESADGSENFSDDEEDGIEPNQKD